MAKETYPAAYASGKSPHFSTYISYGLPYPQACTKHVAETFYVDQIYILA